MNHLIFIANILDPRDKFEYIKFSLNTIYGEILGGCIFNSVNYSLYELFEDYVGLYKPLTDFVSQIFSAEPLSQSESGASDSVYGKNISVLKARFKKQKLEARKVSLTYTSMKHLYLRIQLPLMY